MAVTPEFLSLVALYRSTPIEYPHLKPVTLAMWILESGRGASGLARNHRNFAGMKYRKAMKDHATPVNYEAHDGEDSYCAFASLERFIAGFWFFLERSPYKGWHKHAADEEDFISFVGPIWAGDPNYAEKVLNLVGEAEKLLAETGDPGAEEHAEPAGQFVCEACGESESTMAEKPVVNRWEPTSHQSSRNNTDIDHIVIHYTTSGNIEGSISWFKHGNPRTSAHYIIGRDGALVQMVNDSERAWHAGTSAMNARSIGIEHVAAAGDEITPEQAKISAALIRWLMREYDIQKSNVIPHVCVKATSCCGDLFKAYGGKAGASCDVQKKALHKWLTSVGI